MKLFDKFGYTDLTRDLVMGMQIHTTLSSLRRAIGSDEAIIVEATETMPTLYYVKEEKDGEVLGYWIHACAIDLFRFLLLSNPGLASEVSSVEDLQAALVEGGKVILSADMNLPSPIMIEAGMDATLDLNSHNILAETEVEDGDDISDVYAIWAKGGKLTIEGQGEVKAADATYSMAVWATGDSEVVINGGTFVNGGDSCDLIYASGNAKVEIYGGEFKAAGPASGEASGTKNPYSALNIKDKDRETASIKVYGGKFYGFDPANNLSEGDATNFVADGYESVEIEEGVWEVRAIA